jgi:hypothetical protein
LQYHWYSKGSAMATESDWVSPGTRMCSFSTGSYWARGWLCFRCIVGTNQIRPAFWDAEHFFLCRRLLNKD